MRFLLIFLLSSFVWVNSSVAGIPQGMPTFKTDFKLLTIKHMLCGAEDPDCRNWCQNQCVTKCAAEPQYPKCSHGDVKPVTDGVSCDIYCTK